MNELFVFVLRFEDREALNRGYGVVADEHEVESCSVEPDELRIRFLATKKIGTPLLEHIYERGGLTWSSRWIAKT